MLRKTSALIATLTLNFGLLLIVSASAAGQYAFSTLTNFDGPNGNAPFSPLIIASDGNFYGTTLDGGSTSFGTAFKITPDGVLQTLYNFCSKPNCADGATPWAGLALGPDGNFYGTTVYGGANPNCPYVGGCGTIYKLTPAGILTTLYSFDGESAGFPYTSLLLGQDGNFYGTTTYTDRNDGIIFKMTPAGKISLLHRFICCADGSDPQWALVQAPTGLLYGTTAGGGIQNSGIVFSISTSGTFTVLHRFCQLANCDDGAKPTSVIVAANGDLYGTTYSGGNNFSGTVFALSPTGRFKTLYKFNTTIGSNPSAGLIQGLDGNFYGTTYVGGTGRSGTVFGLTPAGVLTTLHNFATSDGAFPQAPLIQTTDGSLYGTTGAGGSSNDGVVFKLVK